LKFAERVLGLEKKMEIDPPVGNSGFLATIPICLSDIEMPWMCHVWPILICPPKS
jgi:hypothetical protein